MWNLENQIFDAEEYDQATNFTTTNTYKFLNKQAYVNFSCS